MNFSTEGLHSRAMLVTLSLSQWSARKLDRKATTEVVENNGVRSTKSAFYKSTIEGDTLEQIARMARKIRSEHYHRTLPWSDAGPRVLSNTGFIEYAKVMGEYEAEYMALVDAFVGEYPQLREDARQLLGKLYDPEDYPHESCVAEKFGFKFSVAPLPMGSDLRVDVGNDALELLRKQLDEQTGAAVQASMRDAFDRVAKVCGAFVDRLCKDDNKFHDSLVENARDLAAILPSLNFTGDAKLTQLTQELQAKLCRHEPQTLREDVIARRQAYKAAVAINQDLNAFFGGGL